MENRDYLRQLFEKYRDNKCSADEIKQLLAYFKKDSQEQNELMELVLSQLHEQPTADELDNDRINQLIDDSYQNIQNQLQHPDTDQLENVYHSRSQFSRLLPYAAAILLFLSMGIYFWRLGTFQESAKTITITANDTKTQQVELPDGSHVWLNAGATLTYPAKFDKNSRKIVLSDGQAYFDIAKDENKHFTVHAGTLKVEVLGTSFEVTAYKNLAQASVAVKSGTVNVSPEHTPSTTGTKLTANQKATLYTKTGTVETTEIDGKDIASWKENRLVFSSDDFPTVIEAIQRKYKVTIDLQKPELLKEKLTLSLDDKPIQTAIKILSLSSNFNYDFANDSTIIIR